MLMLNLLKNKPKLIKVCSWLLFLAGLGWFTASPLIYFAVATPTRQQEHAICANADIKGAIPTHLQNLLLNRGVWNNQLVQVTGQVSYVAANQTYYLRDGIFIVPLNTASCRYAEGFRPGLTLAAVRGTLNQNDHQPSLTVANMQTTVPLWIQLMWSCGLIWTGLLVWFVIIMGLGTLLRKFLTFIGLLQPKPALSEEIRNESKAGTLVLSSIVGLFFWIANPVAGAILIVLALLYGRPALQSQKRKVALAGIILCVAVLVIMSGVTWLYGDLTPSHTLYAGVFEGG